MKTKIGTSFGLAFVMAIGVIATMLAFGLFSNTSKVSASNADSHTATVTVSPTTAGAVAQYTILATGAATALSVGDRIFFTFDGATTVPADITVSDITIKASNLSTGLGDAGQIFTPSAVTVSGNQISITIPDMNQPSTTDGDQGIAAGAGITVVFKQSAGLTNPNLADPATAYDTQVHYENETTKFDSADYTITKSVTFSPASAKRGSTITVTGKGFTATCLICNIRLNPQGVTAPTTGSANLSAVVDGTGTIDANGVFTGTFVATATTKNQGQGNQVIWVTDTKGVSLASATAFAQLAGATPASTSATQGGTVSVTLVDFPTDSLDIATDTTRVGLTTNTAANSTAATVSIPSTGNTTAAAPYKFVVPVGTPTGTHTISILTGGTVRATFTLEIAPNPIEVSPSTAVPGQKVTISGAGFTGGGAALVPVNSSTTGGTTNPASPSTHAEVTIDDSGNLVFAYTIPNTATTRAAGTYTILVTDDGNKSGGATLTIPARTVTLDPESSRRGSTVTVTGAGFPAKSTVTVDHGSTTGVATVTSDSAGNFTTTFVVPTGAGIPSTNTVTATSGATGTPSKTATHKVPGATITVAEASAIAGAIINVTGSGFPGYGTMETLTIGGNSAIPSPAPSTDVDGVFTIGVLVPQLAVGTQAVLVKVGGTTANSSITVTATPVTPVIIINNTEDVFADEITSDNLVRVWRFDNATQKWDLYDPRPAFAAANDLLEISSGDIVWVSVTEATELTGWTPSTLFAGWNLTSRD